MWVEHLKTWLIEATWEKDPISTRWEAVVIMIHLVFQLGLLTVELSWTTMIPLWKGRGVYRGIGLV